jgi:hypothetical protein
MPPPMPKVIASVNGAPVWGACMTALASAMRKAVAAGTLPGKCLKADWGFATGSASAPRI